MDPQHVLAAVVLPEQQQGPGVRSLDAEWAEGDSAPSMGRQRVAEQRGSSRSERPHRQVDVVRPHAVHDPDRRRWPSRQVDHLQHGGRGLARGHRRRMKLAADLDPRAPRHEGGRDGDGRADPPRPGSGVGGSPAPRRGHRWRRRHRRVAIRAGPTRRGRDGWGRTAASVTTGQRDGDARR